MDGAGGRSALSCLRDPASASNCRSSRTAMGETNYCHEEAIWRQRLEEETKGAVEWRRNWGFLANKAQPPPRGFSSNVAKYAHGVGQWTVSAVRVRDDSKEGMAAALSELKARKTMSNLEFTSQLPKETIPCVAQGAYSGVTLVESDTSGVKNREAALLMRTHKFQTLGIACRTAGLDPVTKYRTPIATSHEYGWRAPSASNNRPPLEMFGVADHAKKQVTSRFN